MFRAEPIAEDVLEAFCPNEDGKLARTQEVDVIDGLVARPRGLQGHWVSHNVVQVHHEFLLVRQCLELFTGNRAMPLRPVFWHRNATTAIKVNVINVVEYKITEKTSHFSYH